MRRGLVSALALTWAVACGHAVDEPGLGTLEQPIYGGTESDESDDAAVFVLSTPPNGDHQQCTGTLIAPNLVATALHCITLSETGTFSCAADGSISGATAADGRIGALVSPEDVAIRVGTVVVGKAPAAFGARLFGTGSNQVCRNDIGFILLDRDVDAPLAKVRLSGKMLSGSTVRIVGYGEREVSPTERRYARNGLRVVDVGPESDSEPSISASPRTFVVTEGPCHGDSGGPAFSEETGALLGVYSLTAGESCAGVGIRNVYTTLAPFSGLALEAFAAAGAEPLLEELEPEPTAPPIVAESGCALQATASAGSTPSLLALAALALGLAFRRRRA